MCVCLSNAFLLRLCNGMLSQSKQGIETEKADVKTFIESNEDKESDIPRKKRGKKVAEVFPNAVGNPLVDSAPPHEPSPSIWNATDLLRALLMYFEFSMGVKMPRIQHSVSVILRFGQHTASADGTVPSEEQQSPVDLKARFLNPFVACESEDEKGGIPSKHAVSVIVDCLKLNAESRNMFDMQWGELMKSVVSKQQAALEQSCRLMSSMINCAPPTLDKVPRFTDCVVNPFIGAIDSTTRWPSLVRLPAAQRGRIKYVSEVGIAMLAAHLCSRHVHAVVFFLNNIDIITACL